MDLEGGEIVRVRIEIQGGCVRGSWQAKEPKVVQRNENKSEVEMRAGRAAAGNNAARTEAGPSVKEQKQLFTALGTRKTS